MQVKRHVANFIQKKSAAIGLLEAAAAHGLRTGERAALMAKQLAFQQVFGDGGCVDCNERATGAPGAYFAARRVLVQRASHQLFA